MLELLAELTEITEQMAETVLESVCVTDITSEFVCFCQRCIGKLIKLPKDLIDQNHDQVCTKNLEIVSELQCNDILPKEENLLTEESLLTNEHWEKKTRRIN